MLGSAWFPVYIVRRFRICNVADPSCESKVVLTPFSHWLSASLINCASSRSSTAIWVLRYRGTEGPAWQPNEGGRECAVGMTSPPHRRFTAYIIRVDVFPGSNRVWKHSGGLWIPLGMFGDLSRRVDNVVLCEWVTGGVLFAFLSIDVGDGYVVDGKPVHHFHGLWSS